MIGDLDFLELDWPTPLDDDTSAQLPELDASPPAPGELFFELCTNLGVTIFYAVALFAFVKLAGAL
jgi:hypothetical protein